MLSHTNCNVLSRSVTLSLKLPKRTIREQKMNTRNSNNKNLLIRPNNVLPAEILHLETTCSLDLQASKYQLEMLERFRRTLVVHLMHEQLLQITIIILVVEHKET